MTRDEKNQLIDEIAEKLSNYPYVYLADNSSMTVLQDNALRRMLYKNDVKMQVAKNTLIRKAIEKAGLDWGELADTLKGTTALLYASNQKAPAKALKEFRKKSEKPVLKGAYIDSDVFIGDDQLDMLSTMKTREDLIGEIIGLLQSPARNVISGLQSGGGKLAGILKTLSEKEN